MAAIDAVILDTGPLVAYLEAGDKHHRWAEAVFSEMTGGLITCDAVLSEALFILRPFPQHRAAILRMLRDGVFDLTFSLADESSSVADLMDRYEDVPMSLADACLVRLAELNPKLSVLTLDSDFRIYRRNRRQLISIISPE